MNDNVPCLGRSGEQSEPEKTTEEKRKKETRKNRKYSSREKENASLFFAPLPPLFFSLADHQSMCEIFSDVSTQIVVGQWPWHNPHPLYLYEVTQ
jgi:hypothetical protein